VLLGVDDSAKFVGLAAGDPRRVLETRGMEALERIHASNSDCRWNTERLVSAGRCRLLLDGLNECPDGLRAAAIRELTELLGNYPRAYFCTSDPIAALSSRLAQGKDVIFHRFAGI
jgi:hypothetical protein